MAEEETAAEETAEEAAAPETPDVTPDEAVEVQEADLPEGTDASTGQPGGQIDILLDTTMPIEVRLGQVELEVRDLLKLGPGGIITLDKQAGEPLDLYLKGIRFATGQLVVAGEMLGVRIIEILPAGLENNE